LVQRHRWHHWILYMDHSMGHGRRWINRNGCGLWLVDVEYALGDRYLGWYRVAVDSNLNNVIIRG
jgi:hypothetical protein